MIHKHGNNVNFVPTGDHYDACDKMCMNWSLYVHKLLPPDEHGNTYYTDALTYQYLDHIVRNMYDPWLGTAQIVDMTNKKRAVLDKIRGDQPKPRAMKKRLPTDPPFVYPKQCGTKLHDERSICIMYCVDCGMDFYDHHDITTRVPIHCPFCGSGYVSEFDPWGPNDNAYVHITRTRYATRVYITTTDADFE